VARTSKNGNETSNSVMD